MIIDVVGIGLLSAADLAWTATDQATSQGTLRRTVRPVG